MDSLSYRLSEGFRVGCACCSTAQQEALLAQAPVVLRAHALLSDARARLAPVSIGSGQELLNNAMLAAYGGGYGATEQRQRQLFAFLAGELLHRRCTLALRKDDAEGAELEVLVCSQKALLSRARAASKAVAPAPQAAGTRGERAISTRTSAGVLVRRTWSDSGSVGASDDDSDSDSSVTESRSPHELQPVMTTAGDPSRAIIVRLVDVSTLTPVPEKLLAPTTKRPLGVSSSPLEPEDSTGATSADNSAEVSQSDEGAAAGVTATRSELGGRELRRKPRPSPAVSYDGIPQGLLHDDRRGRMVIDGEGHFTPDDALRHMLRIGYTAPITVRDLPDRGRCVFSEGFIPRGAFVAEYAGQLIAGKDATDRETQYRYVDRSSGSYMFFFTSSGRGHCVDATAERSQYGIGRLISHSRKSPCCCPRRVLVDGVPRLALIASRDIMYDEELCYDYGDTSSAATRAFEWLKN